MAQDRPLLPALITAAVCMIAFSMGWTDGLLQLGLAGAALALCQIIRLPETALSRLSATAALGVYLCHPLVASLLERITGIPPQSLGFAFMTAALALLATVIIGATRRFPSTLLFGPQPVGPFLDPILRRR